MQGEGETEEEKEKRTHSLEEKRPSVFPLADVRKQKSIITVFRKSFAGPF